MSVTEVVRHLVKIHPRQLVKLAIDIVIPTDNRGSFAPALMVRIPRLAPFRVSPLHPIHTDVRNQPRMDLHS